ncbi:hypothetical protein KY349_02010 [Candidatus Woesearchaeota archaeon]|nr:hypothetical protein [Candidatus Woesearchaeota archaeon]
MKRGVGILLILCILISATLVLAETTAVLGPLQVYETNEIRFVLNVSNYMGDYDINEVEVDADGFEVLAMFDYAGWTEIYNGSNAEWKFGSLGSNIMLAVFEYFAQAPVVDEDTETDTRIRLKGVDEEEEYHISVMVLNDHTAPELSNIVPEDEGFVKEGISEFSVQVNATDPETGIDTVEFSWVLCDDENATQHETELEEDGLYHKTVDLSEYENEEEVCFEFSASNNGGEVSHYDGQLTIDGVPPEVTLLSPDDSAIVGLSSEFSFLAADNLAQTMNCIMDIDGEEYMTDIVAENMQTVSIPSADVEEGEHTWSITCLDPAGWEGESETWAYTLDKTPPQISLVAPENNSIIADSTLLEFDVTDNYQLDSVLFVHDGNETAVDDVFNIDVSSWDEGPSEFAVIAEDSVGNRAELTYRIIIDRTPPQIVLLDPADNGTSDVHVNFTYSVLDNYDDAIDCTVYIDDEGQEQQTVQEETDAAYPAIVAIGDHRWKVQCVDDASNTGSSNERSLSVIDTSGPDIAMNNPDVVFRGDPVTISLEVIDISGVEAVTAELRDPDDNIQSIPLEKQDDTYSSLVETTMESTTGTYTLAVYAVDTLNNSNTAEDEILVTYKYVISLELSPSSVTTGGGVDISGSVAFDNGSSIVEEDIELSLPENQADVELIDGVFSHSFTAPSAAGTYDVVASVFSEGNEQVYSAVEQFSVAAPQQQSSGGSGGGGGGGHHRSQDEEQEYCIIDWQCTAWTMCEEGEQKRVCVDMNHCDTEDKKVEERSCTETNTEEENDDGTTEGDTVSATREPLPEPEEHEVDATEEDEGDAAGIGKASGFMNMFKVSPSSIIFALLLMALLLGTLYKYGWSKGDKRKKPAAVDLLGRGDKIGLESYLDERASRRR